MLSGFWSCSQGFGVKIGNLSEKLIKKGIFKLFYFAKFVLITLIFALKNAQFNIYVSELGLFI